MRPLAATAGLNRHRVTVLVWVLRLMNMGMANVPSNLRTKPIPRYLCTEDMMVACFMPCRQGLGMVTLTVTTCWLVLTSELTALRSRTTVELTALLAIRGSLRMASGPLVRLNMLSRIRSCVNPMVTMRNLVALRASLTEWWPPCFLKLLALPTVLVLTSPVATPATVVGARLRVPVTRV